MPSLIDYKDLKRQYELDGPRKTCGHMAESLEQKHLKPEDFSLKELAEAVVPDGREWVRSLDPRHQGSLIAEAGDAVDSTAFSNITGQIVYTKIMEGYQSEAFVASQLIPNVPTRLRGEKIPGVANLREAVNPVNEGMPYESLGFGEDYIETPVTTKRGHIVPVTKEAVFFDRTNLVLDRASAVGQILGLNKEKRLLDLVIGATNNYKWKGASYNTYQASSPWSNVISGNELIDWTDVDAVEQLFADMIDPNTDEPVLIATNQVLVCPAYQHAANRVFKATEIRYTASGAPTQTLAANPLNGYQVASSRLMYRRIINSGVAATNAKKWWFAGDFSKAFAYMENWPITVVQAPTNSEAEFTQDVVARFKASEMGAAAVMNPRYVAKSYDN